MNDTKEINHIKHFSAKLKEQFINRHSEIISKKLIEYMNEKKQNIPAVIRFFLSKVYLIFFIISLLVGLITFIVWTRLFDANFANPNTYSDLVLYLLLGISVALMVISLFFLGLIWPLKKRAEKILNKSINHKEFFKIIFENLEDFDFTESIDKLLLNLVKYRQRGFPKIGDNASIFKFSPLFIFNYLNHQVVFQTQAWTWEQKLNGVNKNLYANVGMIEYSLSPEEKEQLKGYHFSLVSVLAETDNLKKIKLDSEEFNKKLKLRSNDEQLSKAIFTKDVQNTLLENFNAIDLDMYHIQKIDDNILVKFLPSSPKVLKVNFHYSDNFKKEVDFWTNNTLNEIYQMFALISIITTPNYLISSIYKNQKTDETLDKK
ncbi:hypothetical protein CJJ23_04650 [Mycoplasmopsis agassizii]|uniref:DUF3137 domain-containing protein n=1 Tax=Mycoplasmopsis agassizii TaxID=33922 RepID=A0A269THP9_9BACT|nr:hypothetical protein [Mycoplasmopsis agassizii]PAK20917.1 hypothetical protein CJJ23_04650 [Mycoplasmopsis agassizii]